MIELMIHADDLADRGYEVEWLGYAVRHARLHPRKDACAHAPDLLHAPKGKDKP